MNPSGQYAGLNPFGDRGVRSVLGELCLKTFEMVIVK